MTLIPERFLRFAIRDLVDEVARTDDEEKKFWLSRLREYYAIEHGDIEENARHDHARFVAKFMDEQLHMTIELEEILPQDFTFVGHEKGLKLREELHLEQEDWKSTIRIAFPSNTYTISYSFFKGLFCESIHKAGTSDAFFKKYIIECPEHLKEILKLYVHRILRQEPV